MLIAHFISDPETGEAKKEIEGASQGDKPNTDYTEPSDDEPKPTTDETTDEPNLETAEDPKTTEEPKNDLEINAPRLQTHVEVLWRTIIANTYDRIHPAPLEAGYGFADELVGKILLLFYGTIYHREGADEMVKEQGERATLLKCLSDSELNGFITMTTSNKIIAEEDGEESENKEENNGPTAEEDKTIKYNSTIDSFLASIPKEERKDLLTKFLPEFNNVMDLMSTKAHTERGAVWSGRFAQVMHSRRLFLTRNMRRLGNGPQSAQAGDVVAVAAGGRVPLVLRPVGDKEERKYTLVGECYVHGLMHGEALEGGFPVENIYLV